MKTLVRMLRTAAGTEGVWLAGSVVEVEDTLAAVLVRIGAAERVVDSGAPEAAVMEPEEKAVRPRPKPRGRRGGL